jgi:hypothetical protein
MFTGRKLALTLAFTVLVALAFGVGCRGFFQKNVLVTVAVQPPSPTVMLNSTTTLQAYGTYQDGTRSLLTSGVAWTSSAPEVLSIDPNSGVATGVSIGPAQVTASSQAISGTASATVFITVTSLSVLPNTWTFKASDSVPSPGFVVTANGTTNITSSTTFTPSTSTITCADGTNPVVCTSDGTTLPNTYTIVISYTGTNITTSIAVTATP